jgi:glycerophosphoryl diester phosphodiesterase
MDRIATVELARGLGAPITMHEAAIPAATVSALQEAGVAVWVWGVTDEESIARGVSQGVDGILGKDIAALVKALDRLCPRIDQSPAASGA